MKNLIRAFLLSMVHLAAQAQGGCLHTYHRLFVVDLVFPETWKWVDTPELVLVNEDSVPYMNPSFYVDERYVQADVQQFLLNDKSSYRQQHPGQVWQVWEKLPEDVYTIIIPAQPEKYQIRIVVRHDRTVDTLYYPLSNHRSLDICKNELDKERTAKAITFDDGTPFTPIRIDLGQPPAAPVPTDTISEVYLRFDTRKVAPAANGDTLAEVYRVRVYDAATLSLIQTVPITGTMPFHPNNRYAHIEEFPLFRDAHPPGIPDFRILAELKTDTQQRITEQRFEQYVFDAATGRYQRHEAISAVWNVKVDANTGVITQYAIEHTPEKTIVQEYQFRDDQWVPLQRREIARETYRPAPQSIAGSCTAIFVAPGGMRPVKPLSTWLGEYLIRDSLMVTNQCTKDQKVFIDKQYPGAQYFSAPAEIPAAGSASVRMEEVILMARSLQLYTHEVRIGLPDGSFAARSISYFTAWDSTAVRDPLTGKVIRYVSEEENDSLTYMALDVDASGMPTAYGPILKVGGKRVGTWRTWDAEGRETAAVTYSLRANVVIYTPERMRRDMQVLLRVNGVWEPVEYAAAYEGITLYIPVEADSIHIISGDASARERIDRRSLHNFTYTAHSLLLPGESYVRSGYSKFPVAWDPDGFALLWDQVYLSKAYPNIDGRKRLREHLKAKYAGVLLFAELDDTEFRVIFPPGSSNRKAGLLQQLQAEPGILAVAQVANLPRNENTYLSPTVTIQFAYTVTTDSIYALAKAKNATVSMVFGAPNLCTFTFSDTLIDAAWVDRMHQLILEPGVEYIYFNWFSRIYPEEAGE